ncbi:MAG: 3-phosphoshikimate 1-carboxyvinyltransferase [Flavisolibacter sp.]
MIQAIVQPYTLKGVVTAPTSKSAMQRACAAALIKKGKTILKNPGISADDKAALDIIQQLGAVVTHEGGLVIVESKGIQPQSGTINCGESGLSVRMFTSIAALSDQPIQVTGSGSLVRRPLSFFNEVLPELKVRCTSNQGLLPWEIQGPLQPASITVDGSLSSQFLTGLLMAYAGAGASGVTIRVNQLNSKPYIDLTLKVMEDFGLATPENQQYEAFYFGNPSGPTIKAEPLTYTVEGDWSGGAFLLVAGALGGDITVLGLDVFSTQADKAILQALMQAGAHISIEERQIMIRESRMKAFHFNATDCPDLFPPLVALAACCEGTSVVEGVHRLTHKESNRALTLQEEFQKMGVEITLQDDLMLIKGGGIIRGAHVHSHHDHRIAMACAVAGLRADGPMIIDGAEAVNKSYPQFWEDLQKLHTPVSLNQI